MGKTNQFNIKCEPSMRDMINSIGVYEGENAPELVRSWIVEKIKEYRKDKCFMRELEKGNLRPEKELMAEIEQKGSFSEDLGKEEET